jgi:hypothetical protein
MKSIWKYNLKIGIAQEIRMPSGAEILTAQIQYSELVLWALVDEDNKLESRMFVTYPTGMNIEETKIKYINTFQFSGGSFVLHLFEILN